MISPSITGAVAELRVTEDVMARGYHVFRNLGSNGPVDFVALSARGLAYLLVSFT